MKVIIEWDKKADVKQGDICFCTIATKKEGELKVDHVHGISAPNIKRNDLYLLAIATITQVVKTVAGATGNEESAVFGFLLSEIIDEKKIKDASKAVSAALFCSEITKMDLRRNK